MNAAAKLVAFAAVLALAFGGAALAGAAFGPAPVDETEHSPGHAAEATHAAEAGTHPVRGLAVAENGLRLILATPELPRGADARLRFEIADGSGTTVRDFDVTHERRLHLIVVRRDLTGFQHLHPEQLADGSWETPIRLGNSGSYRLFADFVNAGEPYTLATDLRVDGSARLAALPAPESIADAGNGYRVRIDDAAPRAGEAATLSFGVEREGREIGVEPYLGANGHLVALREGDLAFLHVHPTEHSDSEAIGFEATFPTAGRYRLFLQFKHEGVVRTAAFTQEVE